MQLILETFIKAGFRMIIPSSYEPGIFILRQNGEEILIRELTEETFFEYISHKNAYFLKND